MKENKVSQAGEPPLPSQKNPPARILLVDDDRDSRQINTEVLMDSGYQVDAAEDGAVAWDTLQTNRYDLLITDNKMPKVSGVELLGMLQAARMTLPVIMATGVFPTQPSTSSLRPDALLLKPYTIGELLGTVKEVLRATGGVREPIAPPTGPDHPSADGSQP